MPISRGALRDGVAEHAVGSGRSQEQCHPGKDGREQRGRTTRDKAFVYARIHRMDVIDRDLGLVCTDQCAERLGKSFRVSGSSAPQ